MNFRKIILGVALTAAPVQSSIIATLTDPGLPLLQDFSVASPALPKNVSLSSGITNFSGITLSTMGNGLVYDTAPTQNCHDNFSPDPDCITNFTADASNEYTGVTSTDLTFQLTTAPKKTVAFWAYFDPTLGYTTFIQVYNLTKSLIDTVAIPPIPPHSPNWYTVTENSPIGYIQIVGYNVTTPMTGMFSAYGLVLSHVETLDIGPIPEPGTIAMCGLGLGALGFFARRRKSLFAQ